MGIVNKITCQIISYSGFKFVQISTIVGISFIFKKYTNELSWPYSISNWQFPLTLTKLSTIINSSITSKYPTYLINYAQILINKLKAKIIILINKIKRFKEIKKFLTTYIQLTIPNIYNQPNIKNVLTSNKSKLI